MFACLVSFWDSDIIDMLPNDADSFASCDSLPHAIMSTFHPHHTHAVPMFQSRRSTSSGQGRSLSDLTQIRRLKHVSGKASKTRSNTLSPAVAQSSDQGWAAGIIKGAGSSGSVPPSPNLSQKAPSTTTSDGIRLSTTSQNPQFSTADRTILEELKRSITARAAQFTTKGAGIVEGCGVTRPGKKHHPYRREEVPYPRSYDREVLDL